MKNSSGNRRRGQTFLRTTTTTTAGRSETRRPKRSRSRLGRALSQETGGRTNVRGLTGSGCCARTRARAVVGTRRASGGVADWRACELEREPRRRVGARASERLESRDRADTSAGSRRSRGSRGEEEDDDGRHAVVCAVRDAGPFWFPPSLRLPRSRAGRRRRRRRRSHQRLVPSVPVRARPRHRLGPSEGGGVWGRVEATQRHIAARASADDGLLLAESRFRHSFVDASLRCWPASEAALRATELHSTQEKFFFGFSARICSQSVCVCVCVCVRSSGYRLRFAKLIFSS